MSGTSNQITTLLLDSAFMPLTFLTGRSTFLHLLKNNIKCFDAADNLIEDSNHWFSNEGVSFFEDQPFLTSKNKIWFLPTIAVIKTNFYLDRRRLPKTLNLSKLCVIFDNTCQICYQKFTKQFLTIEHIYPKSKGGTKEIENITLTCIDCNQRKKDIYPFLNIHKKEVTSVPAPIPILPIAILKNRPEWEKFFVYKKI